MLQGWVALFLPALLSSAGLLKCPFSPSTNSLPCHGRFTQLPSIACANVTDCSNMDVIGLKLAAHFMSQRLLVLFLFSFFHCIDIVQSE